MFRFIHSSDLHIGKRFGNMPEERGLYPNQQVADQHNVFGRLSGMPTTAAGEAVAGHLLGLAHSALAKDRAETPVPSR